ncbi:MAG: DUF389 domain-containing protein [Pseudomonadota bacterium]
MSETKPATEQSAARRRLTITLKQLARRVDHEEVVEHVREEGHLSGRYLFMTVMSCAISILGLLLSSPAVIIGAMLISPLMGPIMLMGFSLSILELSSLGQAVFSMFCGVVAALAIAIVIVWLSPLSDATPEILARTRPNFFDLLVAVFSGLAGGYAVIHRKGETIVGVAIATALMPPLAVTGFGIAVGSAQVAGGAFFLFMTNLLAIALTVTLLSRIYGFGAEHSPRHTLWQTGLIIAVFGALSVPLGIALRDISYEATATNTIRGALLEPFGTQRARIGDLDIAFPRDAPVRVDATILTPIRSSTAETELMASLPERISRPIEVNLDQVLIDEDQNARAEEILQMAESSLAAPLRAEISRMEGLAQAQRTEAELRNAVPFALTGADINAEARTATLFAKADPAFTIATYRVIEMRMSENYPEWTVRVIPPIQALPPIPYAPNDGDLDEPGQQALADCLWALDHWGVLSAEVVGYAQSAVDADRPDEESIAYRRASLVALKLLEAGFDADPITEYRPNRAPNSATGGTVSIRPKL